VLQRDPSSKPTFHNVGAAVRKATHQTIMARQVVGNFLGVLKDKLDKDALQAEIDKLEAEAAQWPEEQGGFLKEKATWLVGLVQDLEESRRKSKEDEVKTHQLISDFAEIQSKLQSLKAVYNVDRTAELQAKLDALVNDLDQSFRSVSASLQSVTKNVQGMGHGVVQELESLQKEVEVVPDIPKQDYPALTARERHRHLMRKAAIVVSFDKLLHSNVRRGIEIAVDDAHEAALGSGWDPPHQIHRSMSLLPGAVPELAPEVLASPGQTLAESPDQDEELAHRRTGRLNAIKRGLFSSDALKKQDKVRIMRTLTSAFATADEENVEVVRRRSEDLGQPLQLGRSPSLSKTRRKVADWDYSVLESLDPIDGDTPCFQPHHFLPNIYHSLGAQKAILPPSLQEPLISSEFPYLERRLRCPFPLIPLVSSTAAKLPSPRKQDHRRKHDPARSTVEAVLTARRRQAHDLK
jgi:hypothetical protein